MLRHRAEHGSKRAPRQLSDATRGKPAAPHRLAAPRLTPAINLRLSYTGTLRWAQCVGLVWITGEGEPAGGTNNARTE